ncbi:uncharacterized protein G2W53_033293 [Senna tora]|uniref:Uncharacterized protein n=1 Tax=Senna tora TaxID=362788 RepID=A0A834W7U1_9FABA|nr:uncharacterized protein G2W53_033293 [Senna tora]
MVGRRLGFGAEKGRRGWRVGFGFGVGGGLRFGGEGGWGLGFGLREGEFRFEGGEV